MAITYLPILVMIVLSVGFAALTLGLSWVLSPRQADKVKDASYECGVDPLGDARIRHSIRFYVVAMLFIVFDLETVFLYPWAVTYKKLGLFGLMEMIVFLVILMVGYVYVWRRGALDWSERLEPGALDRYNVDRMIGGPRARLFDTDLTDMERPVEQRR